MANYRAIANGNWSNLAIWQDDSLGYFANSTVLPTSIDDVYANNFTVTIDGTRTASTIRNTAFTPPTFLGAMSIPQMTSNTTPSGVAAASSFTSGNAAWNAFDRNTATVWQNSVLGIPTGTLAYQFPTGRIIKRYGFFTSGNNANNPRTWTFEGSNNGSTWIVLDTQTNFVTGVATFFSFDTSSNTTSYTYYRLNITATQSGGFITIPELEMSEITNLYGSIVAGGGFTFANGGNLTCSNSQAIFVGAANRPVLEMSLSSGNVGTFTGSLLTITNAINFIGIRLSGTGTLNLIGDFGNTSSSNIATRTIEVTNNGVLNIVGNLSSANTSSVTLGNTLSITSNCLVNITGDVTGNNNNIVNANATIYNITTASVLNITGNVNAATNGNSTAIFLSGTINIVGNVTGNVGQSAIVTGTSTVDVTGVITSGNARPAIRGSELTLVIVRGNVINTDTYNAIYAGRVVIDDNVTSWQFKDSTNTITRTLYTPGVPLGNPATSNVRNGVTYGPALELTGTAFIPSPANVLQGVPVDATVGILLMTPADMWNYLASSITTSGSIGKLIKDNLDVAVSTRLASASYVAPDNADIAAIKAVTDTLTDVATETTSLSIKTKTDLIPNSPASNDSVGAIVASYNV